MIPVHCPLCCDQPFEDQQALFFHLRGLRNNLFCPICSERFASLELLVKHLSRTCNGPKSPKKRNKISVASSSQNDSLSSSSPENTMNDTFNNDSDNDVDLQMKTNDVAHTPVLPADIQKKLLKNKSITVGSSNNKCVQKSNVSDNHQNSNSHGDLSPDLSLTSETPKKVNSLHTNQSISPVPSEAHKQPLENNLPNTAKPKGKLKPGPLSYKLAALSKVKTDNSKSHHKDDKTVNRCTAVRKNKPKGHISVESVTDNLGTKLDNQNGNKESTLKDPETPVKIIGTSPSNSSFLTTAVAGMKRSRPSDEPYKNGDMLNRKVDPLQHTPVKKGRGRPRKADKVISPQNDNVQFVLPEIIDESELQVTSSSNEIHCNQINDDVTVQPTPATKTGVDGLETNQQKCVAQEVSHGAGTAVDESVSRVDPDEEYNCSACNMQFLSIYEHIRLFHNGEEVVVELPEAEITEDLKAFQAGSENKVAIATKVSEIETENDVKPDLKIISDDPVISEPSIVSEPSENSKETEILPDKPFDTPTPKFNPFRSTAKKPPTGKWVRSWSNKREYFQFVHNQIKYKKLVTEFKNNLLLHSKLKIPIKNLFENPKINLIEITNKPDSPCFTFKTVNLKNPIPMYIVERDLDDPTDASAMLGDKASYIIADRTTSKKTPIPEESDVIAVMKVILGSDKLLTIENIVFKEKPDNLNMIPVLEPVQDIRIPLLANSKRLIWQCAVCLATTWKFPQNKDSHSCNACQLCHKPFISFMALQKHMVKHTKDNSRYCKECHETFVDNSLLEGHKQKHETLYFCSLCKLFLSKDKEKEHENLHTKDPSQRYPCSVCLKIFGTSEEVKSHENNNCSKLVAKYNCSLCDKKFYSLTAHTYHTMEHTEVAIKFPCRFCSKMFIKEKEQSPRKARKRNPSRYIQKIWHERIHTRERPFLCSACPKRFRSYLYQRSHEQKVHHISAHRDVPIHMCNVCDKVFRTAQLLTTHLKQHESTTELT